MDQSQPPFVSLGALDDLPGIRHAFFERAGGVSEGVLSSLNCGYGANDAVANVATNRQRALSTLDLEADRLATVYQVHSDRAVVANRPWARGEAPKADALATREPGVALGVLTADCVPVLLADAEARVIGAAHAGWRGALDGIVESVVAAMVSLGAAPERIVAGIGPAIGAGSYEVGPEFPDPFLAEDAGHRPLFRPAPRQGRFLFDIKGYVEKRLLNQGVSVVQTAPEDTCADEDRFFSYRRACLRQETDYGRGLSTICLDP